MLQPREKLDSYIFDECVKISVDRSQRDHVYNELNKKYNIPYDLSSDIVTARKDYMELSNFVMFCVLSVINEKQVKRFFTNEEIKYFSSAKYEIKTVKFPLKIPDMTEITHDQWIGKITARQLKEFAEAGLINYNPNAQRVLSKVVKGENVVWKISINRTAVSDIQSSLERNTYISDTITLNIPEESDFDYSDRIITIKEMKSFDMTDGYHRYLAIMRACYAHDDFDYPMELRITNFPDQKAQQFIYQQDQKTKMTKVDSDSFSQDKVSNLIVQRLNEDHGFDLHGMICRNQGTIPMGELSSMIDRFYVKEKSYKNERLFIVQSVKDIKQKSSYLFAEYQYLLEKEWSSREILIYAYSLSRCDKPEDMVDIYSDAMRKVNDINDTVFNTAVRGSRSAANSIIKSINETEVK